MVELVKRSKKNLSANAFLKISARDLFDNEDLRFIEDACRDVEKEQITIGDVGEMNHLLVGRFAEDKKGKIPVICGDLGKKVLDILTSKNAKKYFEGIMDGEYFIRRCQVNVLTEGGFIGKHIDTYSNFEYKYSCVIQFGKDYDGGDFFVDYNGNEQKIKTSYKDMLVNRCEIPHGVENVTSGNRTSFVFFLSKSPYEEINNKNNQI